MGGGRYSLEWLGRGNGPGSSTSFLWLQVYKRIGIVQVKVYERAGKSVI